MSFTPPAIKLPPPLTASQSPSCSFRHLGAGTSHPCCTPCSSLTHRPHRHDPRWSHASGFGAGYTAVTMLSGPLHLLSPPVSELAPPPGPPPSQLRSSSLRASADVFLCLLSDLPTLPSPTLIFVKHKHGSTVLPNPYPQVVAPRHL